MPHDDVRGDRCFHTHLLHKNICSPACPLMKLRDHNSSLFISTTTEGTWWVSQSGTLSGSSIRSNYFYHDLILFMIICLRNKIKLVPSFWLTACWFWTGATIALSLQSNLAGSPSAFCPEKAGAPSALARRYRSVDYIYGSKKTLDIVMPAKNKRQHKLSPGPSMKDRKPVGSTPPRGWFTVSVHIWSNTHHFVEKIKSIKFIYCCVSSYSKVANLQSGRQTLKFPLWQVRELVNAVFGRLRGCREGIQIGMSRCRFLQSQCKVRRRAEKSWKNESLKCYETLKWPEK